LIKKCENNVGEKPVLVGDLDGFWDMIFFQVGDITICFHKPVFASISFISAVFLTQTSFQLVITICVSCKVKPLTSWAGKVESVEK